MYYVKVCIWYKGLFGDFQVMKMYRNESLIQCQKYPLCHSIEYRAIDRVFLSKNTQELGFQLEILDMNVETLNSFLNYDILSLITEIGGQVSLLIGYNGISNILTDIIFVKVLSKKKEGAIMLTFSFWLVGVYITTMSVYEYWNEDLATTISYIKGDPYVEFPRITFCPYSFHWKKQMYIQKIKKDLTG